MLGTGGLVALGWFVGLGALVAWAVRAARRAGPFELDLERLRNPYVLRRVEATDADAEWDDLGKRTEARGLDIIFHHDDDPHAEATLVAPRFRDQPRPAMISSRPHRITLDADFTVRHVHHQGYVFRLALRGTGDGVGRQVELKVMITGGQLYGGSIANDDDHAPAVGSWIEVQWAELLEVRRS